MRAAGVGGVTPQLTLSLVSPPHSLFMAHAVEVLTWTNLWLIGLNLVPVGGFDGVEAWKLWRLWRGRRPGVSRAPRARTAASHLRVVPRDEPSDITAEMRRLVEQAARDARERERRNRLN